MPTCQSWAKFSLWLLITATMSGCALDPVGLLIQANAAASRPSEASLVAESADHYRQYYKGFDCNALEQVQKAQLETIEVSQRYREAAAINRQALRQVMSERGCGLASAATAVTAKEASTNTASTPKDKALTQAETAASGAVPVVRPAEPQGSMGVAVLPVTNEIAQAVGLPQRRGMLVTQVLEGQSAAASGIRPGDILLEVAGLPVDDAYQIRRALGLVPDGQSIMVRVWRGNEQRDLIVGPISSNTPALPAGAVYAGAPAPLPETDRFCVLQLRGSGMFADGLLTPVIALRNDGSEKANAKVAAAFMQSVQQAQPGKWQPQPTVICNKESSVCSSASAQAEVLMMLCETDAAKVTAMHDALQRQKSMRDFSWTAPAR
ncbi:hypothetical protein C0J09_07205 [Bordetella avium]|uniref:S1C family serine protease n=1 Tax=Bordetella avium TaxID=521 RepID=UPI000FD9C061|nr:PDZ domain-containing protein [Bordetella avium]AZY48950.1 hypothetical protein C0J09_07205 [Bordetella avium]